jgi:hypothetical protein
MCVFKKEIKKESSYIFPTLKVVPTHMKKGDNID